MLRLAVFSAISCLLAACHAVAQDSYTPQPDDRFKADILVVVAHPDDETMIGSWLATQIFKQGRRAAVIFTTHGEQGGNAGGPEQYRSLGAIREIEARTALTRFHIPNVWFLQGSDTPGQDVLRSLGRWPHGAILEETVRLIRLTRPEVVITWLPAPIPLQHGDHQAAGIVATEAFDIAANTAWFGEQLADARDSRNISNFTDGLRPWQPKALLYVSDGDLTGVTLQGPVFRSSGSYARIAAEEQSAHLTQSETGRAAIAALASGQLNAFEAPIRFFLGKCLDTPLVQRFFQGTTCPVVSANAAAAKPPGGLHFSFGGPWQFYRNFWAAHGLSYFAAETPVRLTVPAGGDLIFPLVIENGNGSAEQVEVETEIPAEWRRPAYKDGCQVAAHSSCAVNVRLSAPSNTGEFNFRFTAQAGNRQIGTLSLKVRLDKGILPQ